MKKGYFILFSMLTLCKIYAQKDATIDVSRVPQFYYSKLERNSTKIEATPSKKSHMVLPVLAKQVGPIFYTYFKMDSFKSKELRATTKEMVF